jgi:hypothetical protein
MPYPTSSDVSAGDITASAQYNNLRSDALRLGNLTADAVNFGSLVEFFESKLNITRLTTTTLRVPASAAVPVGLIVYGVPVRAVANVDLAAGDAPSGGANTWYVFANRVAGSTTFTLSVSTVSAESANQRRIGQFYWDGTKIVKDSIQTELSLHLKNLLYFKEPIRMCGRLGLSTGDPIPASDIASSAIVYFTPYKGNRVSLYVPNYGWRVYTFTELTLDVSGYTNGKNYDIFLYDNAGTLTLEGLVWSNDTLRATALYNQDGVWVKTNATDRLYLGTIRMSGAGTTADTLKARLVWNNYNRVLRPIKVIDTTNTWTYATAAWRQMNNAAANKFEYVVGLIEEPLFLEYMQYGSNPADTLYFKIGFGLDVTNASTPTLNNSVYIPTANANALAVCVLNTFPLLGYHYIALLEYVSTATVTLCGDNGSTETQTGAHGWINS